MSSLEILSAVPLPSASACALRSLASDGATGPVTMRSRDKFLPSLSTDTLNRFEEVFKKVNATLK